MSLIDWPINNVGVSTKDAVVYVIENEFGASQSQYDVEAAVKELGTRKWDLDDEDQVDELKEIVADHVGWS